MPKLTHDQLQDWYKNFKKELYEKANIDMDNVLDIGRIRNFHYIQWSQEAPLGGQGLYMYACIPHKGLEYKETPPGFTDPEEYLNWVMDHLQVPTTDEQIQTLYNMSREGTLMVTDPGKGDDSIRQVYTNEDGTISTSYPLDEMFRSDTEGVPADRLLPEEPAYIPPKEPNAEEYNLKGCPKKRLPPTDPNPGFLSMLGYFFGFNTEYAKKVRFEKYQKEYKKWYDALDDTKQNVRDYKEAKETRDRYLAQVKEYMANPLGKAIAIQNCNRGYKAEVGMDPVLSEDPTLPTQEFSRREPAFMKEKHMKTEQGRLLKKLEETQERLAYANRTKDVIRNLLGADPSPNFLYTWMDRNVFEYDEYKPKAYELPQHPDSANLSEEEKDAFSSRWRNLADIAGIAALAHPEVAGKNLEEGFDQVESANIKYSMLLNNMITAGRQDGKEQLTYLTDARAKAKIAIDAYGGGNVKPLADLIRNSIQMNNKQAANITSLDTEHPMNTLYIINRMWDTLQGNEELRDAVGLTPEEIETTKANVALYSVIRKGMEAREALLQNALFQKNMTPEEMTQASADMLLFYRVSEAVADEHLAMGKVIEEKPEYKKEEAKMTDPAEMAKAVNRIKLIDEDRPCFNIAKDLINDQWVKDAKAMLIEKCNLSKLSEIPANERAMVISSKVDFMKKFDKKEVTLPKRAEPNQEVSAVKQQQKEQGARGLN